LHKINIDGKTLKLPESQGGEMKKASGVIVFAIIIPLIFVLLAACPGPAPTAPAGDMPQDIELVVMGFRVGTASQLRADAIAEAIRVEYPDWKVNSIAAGGESQMMSKRIESEADFFITPYPRPLEVEFQTPLHPDIDFAQATEYSFVMPSSPHYIHFFAHGRIGLSSIKEIVDEKRQFTWGIGAGGSTLVVEKVFNHYGASWEEAEGWGMKGETVFMSSPDGAEALQSGRVDAGLTWAGIPCPPYIGVTFDMSLLPIDDPGLVQMFEELGYYEAVIPADTYPFLTENIPTMAETSHLVARPDVSEDVVYYALKAIFNNKDILIAAQAEFESQLTPEAIARTAATSQQTGVPIHPGALKFYREMGWLD
jgi:TRAP transporter TAXI family solute receptor